MYIIVVEDDPIQRAFIEKTISDEKELSDSNIKSIVSESEFRKDFEDIAANNPDLLIVDSMIRWADPSLNMEKPPQEILDEGFYRAGIRCIKALNDKYDRTKNIPVIIYSVLDYDDLEKDIKNLPQAKYLIKGFKAENLIEMIKSRLKY